MKIRLNENEKKMFEKHPSFIIAIFYFILFAISIGFIIYLHKSESNNISMDTNCFLNTGIACFSIVFLVKSLASFVECILITYIITNKRIVIQSFNLVEINFDKVESIATNSNLIFELFGVGTILVTGTGGTVLKLKNVPNYLIFRENLLKTQEKFNKKNQSNNGNTPINNNILVPQRSKVDELKELKALLDSGALTQEEFDIEKQKILSKN